MAGRLFRKKYHEETRFKDKSYDKSTKYNFLGFKKGVIYNRIGKYEDEVYRMVFGNLYVKDKFEDWRKVDKKYIPKGKVFYRKS